MVSKIKNIANITSGIYAKPYSTGEVYYIQARDFNNYGLLKTELESVLLWDGTTEKHFLMDGDVIIASKGFDNFSATYRSQVTPAVASSIFLVIRNIDQSKILPEYLSWYINHPDTQKFLKRMSKGTNLPSLNKKIIGDLEIEIPSIRKQELILKISELRIREKQLKDNIEELKENLLIQQLTKAIKNE